MHPATLDVTVVRDADEAQLLLRGDLDLTSAYLLDAELARALERGARRIVFDLSGTAGLDMAGVRALIDGARAARAGGAQMRVAGAGSKARTLVDALCVQQVLGMDQDPVYG